MNTHEEPCPSCTQTIHFPVTQGSVVTTVQCPSCHIPLWVRLNPPPASPSLHPLALHASARQNPHRRDRVFSALRLEQPGDTQITAKICSPCQQRVTKYRFTTSDGFSIATYHCMEHGDVIPTHADARHNPLRLHS